MTTTEPRNQREYTVQQIAERLKCNPVTIRRHIRAGDFGEVRREMLVQGRPQMISEAALAAFRKRLGV